MRLICYPESLPVVPPDTGSHLTLLFILLHIVTVQSLKEKDGFGQEFCSFVTGPHSAVEVAGDLCHYVLKLI